MTLKKNTKSSTKHLIRRLNKETLEKQWDELDHKECCLYQQMDASFIEKHINDIDWHCLSVNPFLTIEILDKFKNKISWESMCLNMKIISDTVIYNYKNKMVWQLLLPHQQLNTKLLVVLSEYYRTSRCKNRKMFWKSVSRYQKIDSDYVDTYKRYLDFKEMSYNLYITENIIERYLVKFDPAILMKTRKLSHDLIQRHISFFEI